MKKRITNRTAAQKLVLHREAIAVLAPIYLEAVAGGSLCSNLNAASCIRTAVIDEIN